MFLQQSVISMKNFAGGCFFPSKNSESAAESVSPLVSSGVGRCWKLNGKEPNVVMLFSYLQV